MIIEMLEVGPFMENAYVVGCEETKEAVVIDPELLKDADAEMLQDLVLTAVNLALDKSRELQEKTMGPLTSGLPF